MNINYYTWDVIQDKNNGKYYVIGTDLYGNKQDSMYSYDSIYKAIIKQIELNSEVTEEA